ncbi:MAG: DUF2817 domain-containing protein [Herminiimonas sp.]|nr:DUF2817 domain-containing protein [Herminiimonas sp.]
MATLAVRNRNLHGNVQTRQRHCAHSPDDIVRSAGRPVLRTLRNCAVSATLLLLGAVAPAAALAKSGAAKPVATAPARNDTAQWCARLSERLPGVTSASCQKQSLVATGARSRNGFPILIRRFSPPKSRDLKNRDASHPPIRILLLGGIHGDELTASAIVFQWMKMIPNGAAQNFAWNVVPVLNPDGLLAARPLRVNANGIDLNRNFPTPNWSVEAPRYWVKETGSDPRRFPGKVPLSEPETRWVNDEMQRFKPQVIISVHAPFGVLDFDGPAPAPRRFGRLVLNPVGVYPGSLGNYSGKFKNVPVITIELPNALAMPTDAEAQKIWLDMLDWLVQNTGKPAPG